MTVFKQTMARSALLLYGRTVKSEEGLGKRLYEGLPVARAACLSTLLAIEYFWQNFVLDRIVC